MANINGTSDSQAVKHVTRDSGVDHRTSIRGVIEHARNKQVRPTPPLSPRSAQLAFTGRVARLEEEDCPPGLRSACTKREAHTVRRGNQLVCSQTNCGEPRPSARLRARERATRRLIDRALM